jgi:hypothetical protein
MTTSTIIDAKVAYDYLSERGPEGWSGLKPHERNALNKLVKRIVQMRESLKCQGQFIINFDPNGSLTNYNMRLTDDFKNR